MLRDSKAEVEDGWWALSTDGKCTWSEQFPLAARVVFTTCKVDGLRLGVLLDSSELAEDDLLQLQRKPPPGMEGVVLVRSVRPGPDASAIIEIVGESPPLHTAAIAAACSAFDTGSFDFVPKEYLVSNDAETLVVFLEFDEDSGSWSASVKN